MHIAISEKIRSEFGFGNGFLLGCILPDIYKIMLKNKELTHFEQYIYNQTLPDINNFMEKYKNNKCDLVYGYLSHLIEDEIWFREYMNTKYKKKTCEKIYNDYSIIDKYIIKKHNINFKEIKNNILLAVEENESLSKDKNIIKEIIEDNVIDYPISSKINFFATEVADEYFEKSYKEVKRILESYIER